MRKEDWRMEESRGAQREWRLKISVLKKEKTKGQREDQENSYLDLKFVVRAEFAMGRCIKPHA